MGMSRLGAEGVGANTALEGAARRLRSELSRGQGIRPGRFTSLLDGIPAGHRDAWLDLVWDLEDLPPDDPNLPRGCVPYLPCTVATLREAVHQARVTADDVFVDVGSGAGRAALLAHLETGAGSIGIEIQPDLVTMAQARADWLGLTRVRFVRGDAAELVRFIPTGTVFFLYCPFAQDRLRRFLAGLRDVARARTIRVCCVDMPELELPWLTRQANTSPRVHLYQSTRRAASER